MRSSLIATTGAIVAAASLITLITMPALGIRMSYVEIIPLVISMVIGLAILVIGVIRILTERRS